MAKLLWILLAIVIPADLFLKVICVIFGMIMAIISYLYYLLQRINKSLILLSGWIDSISDRKIINIIFRAAFVISVTSVVLVNRYCQCLVKYESSTGGLEFIASAIVIPLIFSWILEYRTSSTK